MDEKKLNSENGIHNIIIENREFMSISGVDEITSFDEYNIVLLTQMGDLSISGNGLKINKLNVESGEIEIEGYINGITYMSEDGNGSKKGFWTKLFQ